VVHAGKRGHQLRGDNFAFTLLAIFKEAITDLEKLLLSSKRRFLKSSETTSSSRRRLRPAETSSSPPLSLEAFARIVISQLHLHFKESDFHRFMPSLSVSSSAEKYHLSSVNKIISHYFSSQYVNSSFPPPVPVSYKLPETNHPAHCYTDFEPRHMNSLYDIMVSDSTIADRKISGGNGSRLSWKKERSPFDVKILAKIDKIQPPLGYLDRKYAFMSSGNFSKLSLNITIHHVSSIWLCELRKSMSTHFPTFTDFNKGSLVNIFFHHNMKAVPFILSILPVCFSSSVPYCFRFLFLLSEMEYFADWCYRSIEQIPVGNHLVEIEQSTEKQVI
jgi:hypothetical protein